MILTIDLGTSVTKVVIWGDNGVVAVGRSTLQCNYSAGNRAEQDPATWWPSVVAASAQARAEIGASASATEAFGSVEAIGFAAARQTLVAVRGDGTPLGPALLWSDRRAGAEARALAGSLGAGAVRRRTGIVLDAGSVAAKIAWLTHHDPAALSDARWLLAPRDLIAWRLTGEVCTDHTLASATGLFGFTDGPDIDGGDGRRVGGDNDESVRARSGVDVGVDGGVDVDDGARPLGPLFPGLADAVAGLLPPSVPSATVVAGLLAGPAAELGLRAGIPVVIGAGDRACEVLGAHASETWPMVSWGTTANVSVPVARLADISHRDDTVDSDRDALIVTRGALGGWLLEGGLSAAGSLLDWLARLAHVDTGSLVQLAGSSPPGSRGVVVLPWFGGARAPWWRDAARGAIVGLSLDHEAADMARAVMESVAWDVARCLEAADAAKAGASAAVGVVLAGGGAKVGLWTEILTAVTGLPARLGRSGEAASAGAAIVVSRATGIVLDPGGAAHAHEREQVAPEIVPDPAMVATYAALRPGVDAAASAVIELRT